MVNRTAHIKIVAILVSSLFLLIVGLLLNLQYLYLMSFSFALLIPASWLLTIALTARFAATRAHETTAQEGRLLPVTLTLTAKGGLPQPALRIIEELPPLLASAERGKAMTLDDWDGRQGTLTYQVEPLKRGVYRLGPTQVITTDPLGLSRFRASIEAWSELVVHPTPIPMRATAVGGEGRTGVRERAGKAQRGEGLDFHGVREYRPGDALRRVHWPTTARTGRLSVIEFDRAFQRDVIIGLDLARGSEQGEGRETTLEYAIKVAATLAERTLVSGGGVTLVTQTGKIAVQARDGAASVNRFRLFDHLARARADSEESLATALMAARPEDGSHFLILTACGDAPLTAYLTGRVAHEDSVRVFFFEPTSFGGPRTASPAVAGGDLRVIERQHSPWQKGGKEIEYLLRDHI